MNTSASVRRLGRGRFGARRVLRAVPCLTLAGLLLATEAMAQDTTDVRAYRPAPASVRIEAPAASGGKMEQSRRDRRAARFPLLSEKMQGSLLDAWELASTAGPAAAIRSLKEQRVPLAANGEDVVVIVSLSEPVRLQEMEARLRAEGAKVLRTGVDNCKVTVPVGSLAGIALVPGVRHVRPILPPRVSNVIKSQGTTNTMASAWHAAGFTGQNVKVAVVDIGFANLATLKAQDEIPASAVEVNYTATPMNSGTESHGSACAEIVYDLAPGARLYLIKVDDATDLAAARDYCVVNGIGIISCSLGWDLLNFYDGVAYPTWWNSVASHPVTAVDQALANGILWVNSAGNEQERHSLIDWRDGGASPDRLLDWTSGQGNLNVLRLNNSSVLPAGTLLGVYMTWNQWPTTSQDFDLQLYVNLSSGWARVSGGFLNGWSGDEVQNGTTSPYPLEGIEYVTPVAGQYAVAVRAFNATTAPTFILRYDGVDSPSFWGYDNTTVPAPGSLNIPADAASAFTVGAMNQASYPLGPIELFSSLGPNNRGYTGGSAVFKPDLCGPDRTTSVTYGGSFAGTSAATPHVAGLAALVKGAFPGYGVLQLRAYLETNALDLGLPGKDNTFGSGAARLPAAPIPAPTLIVTPTALTIPEGGTGNYTVRLTTQPAATVLVTNTFSSGDTSLAISGGAVLTFTTSNWSNAQPVTILAAEDADGINGVAAFLVRGPGPVAVTVTATEADNDVTPGQIAVVPASWDFGWVALGDNATRVFIVTNRGGTTVTNGLVTVAAPFSVSPVGSFTLPGFGSAQWTVTFQPTAEGVFSNQVLVSSGNGGSVACPVIGRGARAPTVGFTGTPTVGAVPHEVVFTDTSSGAITNRIWNFGDGETLNTNAAIVSHRYTSAGSRTVTLTVGGPVGSLTMIRSGYVLATNVPPSITSQPRSQAILEGANVTFSVSAAGTAPLNFQWRRNGSNLFNGGRLFGAATPLLTLVQAETNDTASYSVLVANAGGVVTSSVAVLSVTLDGFTSIEAWRDFHFGNPAASGAGADTNDFDGDGLSNLAEWALGLNPTLIDAAPLQAAEGVLTRRGQPTVALLNGTNFTALYARRKNRVAAGLVYLPRFSANLLAWQPGAANPAILAEDGEIEVVALPFPVLPEGDRAGFFQLDISTSQPP